jgi:hypothetical protein
LRETPIAAAIWLQVIPLPMQLRSCSMRSGVQVALEGATVFGAGATGAGSRAVDVIGGIAGDESGSDGAIDGDIGNGLALVPRPSGPPTGRLSARSGQLRDPKPRSENRCAALRADPEKDAPDVTPSFRKPVAAGPPKKSAPPSNYAAFHRAASRLKDGKPAVGVAPVRCTLSGPLLVAVEREPSPIRIVARFDSPAKG